MEGYKWLAMRSESFVSIFDCWCIQKLLYVILTFVMRWQEFDLPIVTRFSHAAKVDIAAYIIEDG